MVYDYRELVFKEMLDLGPEDEFYYTKRFKKARLLLNKTDYEAILGALTALKVKYSLDRYSLYWIERKLKRASGLKVRDGDAIRTVPKVRLIKELGLIDDRLDLLIKLKAPEIRFTGSMDFIRRASAK